jgi:uncharacterized protein with GYD domain
MMEIVCVRLAKGIAFPEKGNAYGQHLPTASCLHVRNMGEFRRGAQKPTRRVRPAIEKLGGTILHGWFAFGDYDLVAVLEMPSNVEAAAFSVAASAGGALKSIKTTPLLSLEEGLEALKKAGTSGYKAPSQGVHA